METDEIKKILPNCIITNDIETHSAEWHKYRAEYIGGSEVGTILGINKFASPIKLYYNKLGLVEPWEGNALAFLGSYFESSIKDLWKYFDGGEESYVKNYQEKRIIRDFIDIDCFIGHKDYPWLSGSVDAVIDYKSYHGLDLTKMERLENYGILECKRQTSWSSRSFADTSGVSPGFQLQLQTYLLLTGLQYGELAILRENGLFVEVVLANEEIQKQIISATKKFYNKHLVPGRKAKAELDKAILRDDLVGIDLAHEAIHDAEPDVMDETDDYKNYISETFNKDREFTPANSEVTQYARESVMIKKIVNELELKRKGINSKISAEHSRSGCEYFNFGMDSVGGYTRYYRKGNNKKFELNIKLTEKPEDVNIHNEVKKLNFEF